MNVSLTPELERVVNEKVESGMDQTASEVVREALRLSKERDETRAHLRADVQAGFDSVGAWRSLFVRQDHGPPTGQRIERPRRSRPVP